MEKKELLNILNEELNPLGYKKKGNYWVINGDVITKIIHLQKSNYSNAFYINYGYILNSVQLGNLTMHVYNRVSTLNSEGQDIVSQLLDFESNISDEQRREMLKKVIHDALVLKIKSINNEQDLLAELKTRPHLNNIPLAVKKYFNLE